MPTFQPAATSGGNILAPDYGRPTGFGPAPLVGFIDPLELVETAVEATSQNINDLLAGKAAAIRSEFVGQAAAAAAFGGTLPFPYGFVAGFAGKEIIPPGSLSFVEYAGLARTLNDLTIRGRQVLANAPGVGGRILRFSSGPVGLAVTGASVIVFRVIDPTLGQQGVGWQVAESLLTGGITQITPYYSEAVRLIPGTLVLQWLGPDEPLVPEEQLALLAFWTKDDP